MCDDKSNDTAYKFVNDEKLIESVRQHVVLYDLQDPKYMDSNYKREIWESIGEELNTSGANCKNRWNNIRDTYRKSLKKVAIMKGLPGAKRIKAYKYSEQLSFLKNYFDENDMLNNFDEDTQPDEQLFSENEFSKVQVKQEEVVVPLPQKYVVPVVQQHQQQKPFSIIKSTNFTGKLKNYHNKRKQNRYHLPQHPVDAFLGAMASSLKQLTPYDWHLAKAELFEVVQKYELKTIMAEPELPAYSFEASMHSSTPSSSRPASPIPSPDETSSTNFVV